MRFSARKLLLIGGLVLVSGCKLCSGNSTTGGDGGTGSDGSTPFHPPGACSPTQASGPSCSLSGGSRDLPEGLAALSAAISGSYAYVVGGTTTVNGTIGSPNAYVATIGANGALGNWTTTTSVPAPLAWAGLAASGGFLYLVGGGTPEALGEVPIAKVWIAPIDANDGTLGDWVAGPELPTSRMSGATVALNGYLYAIGGNTEKDGGGIDNAADDPNGPVYVAAIQADGGLGSWNSTAALPVSGTYAHGAATFGSSIYVVGGYYKGGGVACEPNKILMGPVNPSDGTVSGWYQVTVFTDDSEGGTFVVVGNTMVVTEGISASASNASGGARVLAATINSDGTVADDWLIVATLPELAYYRASAATSTAAYIFGGNATAATKPLDTSHVIEISDGGVNCSASL